MIGAFVPEKCIASTDPVPWISESWTPEKGGLIEGQRIPRTGNQSNIPQATLEHVYTPYHPNMKDVAAMKVLLHSDYMNHNSVGRFTAANYPHYNSVGPHGFSVWTKGDEGDALNFRGPCYHEGGSHWMTLEGALYARGRGAGWHPPMGMHLYRAEILVYNYLHVILDAIYTLQSELTTLSVNTLEGYQQHALNIVQKYKKLLYPLQQGKSIPSKPLHCGDDCLTPPICHTNYEPNYNKHALLSELIVGAHPGWEYIHKEGSQSSAIMNKFGYLDNRPCYEARGGGPQENALSFKIEIRHDRNKYIKVCGYNHKEGLRHAKFYLGASLSPLLSSVATLLLCLVMMMMVMMSILTSASSLCFLLLSIHIFLTFHLPSPSFHYLTHCASLSPSLI